MADRPALSHAAGDREVVVELGAHSAASGTGAERPDGSRGALGREPFGRFRRRLERMKGLPDDDLPGSLGDEPELRLQLMLLREENARLKAARHQPPSTGTAIDHVRLLAAATPDGDMLDDASALLSDALMIREGLDQACAEIQSAIRAVRERLSALTLSPETPLHEAVSEADGASSFSA